MENEHACHHLNEYAQKMCISIVPIFNHLEPHEMAEIVKTIRSVTFKRGEMLFNAGDESNSLYIIHKGRVKIYRIADNGREQLIRVLESGDFTGELALFSESTYDVYAEAMEKTEICKMTREDLQEFLLKYPQISLKILGEFSKRLDQSEMQATSIATEDVDTRISHYLIEQYQKTGSIELTLPMTRKDLASFLGTTPETISRRLASFEDAGWIEQKGQRQLRICNLDALFFK